MYSLYWYCQLFLGGFMCLCGILLLVISVVNLVTHIWFYKKRQCKSQTDDFNFEELSYLSNEAIEFAYNDALQGINLVEKGREKIEKKTEFFLTYLMLCVAGLASILLADKTDMQVKRVIFGWIVANSAMVFFVAIQLFVPNKGWFHYYATPRFLLEKLHSDQDDTNQDLRLIKQRNLATLEIAFKSHNDKILLQGVILRYFILASIAINLLFASLIVFIV